MQRVNPEGLYATIQATLPHLPSTGRIVVVSPPIYSRFFRGKTAYAIGKVGMSVLTKGLAMDFEREGKKDMAITSIWPAVVRQPVMLDRMLLITVRPLNLLLLNSSLPRIQTKPTIYARQPSSPMPSSPSSRLLPLSSTVSFSSMKTFSVSMPESQTFPNTTSSQERHPVVSCPKSYQTLQ